MNSHLSGTATLEPPASQGETLAPLTSSHVPTPLKSERSAALLEANSRLIPGGVVSLNRKVEPNIAFVRASGAHLFDADGQNTLTITRRLRLICWVTALAKSRTA
jgi:hypothetical protein